MHQHANQALYSYWNEVRGLRLAPRRFEIEPARISTILPDAFILASDLPAFAQKQLPATSTPGFRFRLAGTRLAEMFSFEFRGRLFLDFWSSGDQAKLTLMTQTLTAQGGVGVLNFTARDRAGLTVHFESLLLPLFHTGTTVDRILGAMIAVDPPTWLGKSPLVEATLTRGDLIWPDGRPHVLIERLDRQSPFLPSVGKSRIVRHNRRYLRVYEGGLSKSPRKGQ